MQNKKISIVLEGGGMRGAYTCGALSWLIDQGIEIKNGYGISTGAVYLCSYLIGRKDYLHELSTKHICSKEIIGLKAFLREWRPVGYDYLFDELLKNTVKFDIEAVNEAGGTSKIGVYDLEEGKTVYKNVSEIDLTMLKAACSLPILGKIVKIDGRNYLDGGITDMIPIQEAVNDGNEKHLIITTKPGNYVRKKSNPVVNFLMRIFFPKYPSVHDDYIIRHLNYVKQIDLIKSLERNGEAVYIYPSESIPVSRMSGNSEDLVKLYELGRSDMENRKEEILKFLSE